MAVLKRTIKEFKADNLTDWAAALTYYGVLAIFPAIIALVSIIGLIGPSATQPILDNLAALTPGPANDILSGAVKQVAGSRGSAGLAFASGSRWRSGAPRATSARSRAPPTRSTRCPRDGRSGSSG